MPIGDPYISPEDLKSYAQIPVTDVDDDTELSRVVVAVSRAIERHCGRQFNKADDASSRVFHSVMGHKARVDDFYTTDDLVVASVDGGFSQTLTDFTLYPLNGVVDGRPGFPFDVISLHSGTFAHTQRPNVQVIAKWGWDEVPEDVIQATLIQASRIFGRKHSVHGLVGQGDFVFRVSSRLDPDVAEMLQPFRHPQVA